MPDIRNSVMALREILTKYPNSTGNRAQMKALLADYLPGEPMARNLLMIAFDEGIVSELKTIDEIDNIRFHRYVKMITTGFGIAEENARDAISAWCEALSVTARNGAAAGVAVSATEVAWVDTPDDGSYECEVINGGIRIKRFVGVAKPEMVIPNMISGKRVLVVGDGAFFNRDAIEKITISEGIQLIGDGAFSHISSLEEVKLPNTLKRIGRSAGIASTTDPSYGHTGAFQFTDLTSIIIPESVNFIGCCTFFGCRFLKCVQLPNKLLIINAHTFSGCCALESIVLPKKLMSIFFNAFKDCVLLRKVTIFNGLKAIGKAAFSGCRNLSEINIPPSVSSIHDTTFDDHSDDLTILCHPNSYVYDYAKKHGIKTMPLL